MYPQRQRSASYPTLKKLSWWHESIIDWMLLNPEGRLGDAARTFNCTQSWLSIIVQSDLFQARLAARRAELAGEIGTTVIDKLGGIAGQALESIAEKIEKEKSKIALGELRETAEMALGMLGYGTKSAPHSNSGNNVYNFNGPTHVSREVLDAARSKMRLVGARAADPQLPAPTHVTDAEASVPRVTFDDNGDTLPAAGPLPPGR